MSEGGPISHFLIPINFLHRMERLLDYLNLVLNFWGVQGSEMAGSWQSQNLELLFLPIAVPEEKQMARPTKHPRVSVTKLILIHLHVSFTGNDKEPVQKGVPWVKSYGLCFSSVCLNKFLAQHLSQQSLGNTAGARPWTVSNLYTRAVLGQRFLSGNPG